MRFCLVIVWVFLFSAGLFAETGKIASLSPNLTEMVFLLGQGHRLAGRSVHCDYPKEARKIQVVGSFGKPYLEPLIASGAKILITSTVRGSDDEVMLKKAGIRRIVIPDSSFEQYFSALKTLGDLLDCRDQAQEEIAKAKKMLEQIRKETEKIPKEKKPTVLVMISTAPVITAGKKSFINDMIQLAGGRNIAENVDQDYFSCSPEWIMIHQPDIIILCRMDHAKNPPDLKKNSLFANLKAVKSNRILRELEPSLLYRLGPRSFQGIRIMNQFFFEKKISPSKPPR